MSKSEGKKIAIKFTEDLVGEISQGEIGNIYYLPNGIATASNQYSATYSPDRAFQDNANYWHTRVVPVWIQIELTEATYIKGFRWNTLTSSYRPRNFMVQGSNDGIVWDDMYEGESAAVNGWKEFSWGATEKYKFYRWDISTRWSSYIYIYQIELLEPSGNLDAFAITGQEYKYVNGPLIDKIYNPISIERHPTEAKTILFTFGDINIERFNNVEGDLTINYKAQIGNLSGRGGRVDDFIINFTPLDLVKTLNPGIAETITVAPAEIIGEFIKVEYNNRFITETITVAPAEITGELLHIDEVNP